MYFISEQESKELDLVCLGRLGVDLNCGDINRPMYEVTSFYPTVGGSPANVVIGAAKLGLKTGFIGRVSADQLGEFVIRKLQQNKVNVDGVKKDDKGSRNCLAFTEIISPDNCGSILYRDNVADMNLCCKDVSEQYVASAKILLISGTALSSNPSREAVFKAVEYAKRNDTVVAIDLDYRINTWSSMEEASEVYQMICSKCDIIIGTHDEFERVENREIDDEEEGQKWNEAGCSIVIIKHGKKGSLSYVIGQNKIAVAPYLVNHKKTFGAGDAYAAAFLYGLIQGLDIEKCMKLGAASASIVISDTTCSEAMPTKEKLKNFLLEREKIVF